MRQAKPAEPLPDKFPPKLIQQLRGFFASAPDLPPSRSLTSGMSTGEVFFLEPERDASEDSYILKVQQNARENLFYTDLAPLMRTCGLQLPELFLADHQDQWYWLLIEFIPKSLDEDKDDFPFGAEFIDYLRRVHLCPLPGSVSQLKIGAPAWTEGDNNRALKIIEGIRGPDHQLRRWLEERRMESQHLFERRCLITGDPALPNWGRRNNGELVKFDWRGIGRATAAVDLGIVLGAFPSAVMEAEMAHVYLGAKAKASKRRVLTADIHRAAIWNVVKFLSGFERGRTIPKPGLIEGLIRDLPQWITEPRRS